MLSPLVPLVLLLTVHPTSSLAQTNTTLPNIPACAITCTLSTIPTSSCASYGVSNITCICTDVGFQAAFFQCQQASCSPTDFQAAAAYGQTTCESNGTPINITAIPTGVVATSSAAPASSAAATTTVAGTASAAAATTSKSAGFKREAGVAAGAFALVAGGLALLV